jgi:hypothetical protein
MREWIGLSSRQKYDTEFVNLDQVNQFLREYIILPEWSITDDQNFND